MPPVYIEFTSADRENTNVPIRSSLHQPHYRHSNKNEKNSFAFFIVAELLNYHK